MEVGLPTTPAMNRPIRARWHTPRRCFEPSGEGWEDRIRAIDLPLRRCVRQCRDLQTRQLLRAS